MNGDNLPYQSLDVVPFTPITSEWGDGIGENILALAGGTGFDAGAIGTDTLAQSAVTPEKTSLFNYQTDNSNTIASVIDGAIKMQMGWGQIVGDGTAAIEEAVSFPEQFTTVLGVTISLIGAKASPAAADITGLTLQQFAAGGGTISAGLIDESGFRAELSRTSGTFSNSVYYGFSWIAWGII